MQTTQKDFDDLTRAVKNRNSFEDLKKILENFDVTATDKNVHSCLVIACSYSNTAEAVSLVFDKIIAVGGIPLLKNHFSGVHGSYVKKAVWTPVVSLCRYCESPLVAKVVFEKIVEIGGTEFAVNLFAASRASDVGCLQLAYYQNSNGILKLIAALCYSLGIFKQEYETCDMFYKARLREEGGISSSSWSPDRESMAEAETVLQGSKFFSLLGAIHANQHSRMKDIMKNDLDVKKILDSKFNIVELACFQATTETMKLLFSEIKRVGGGGAGGTQYLKELLLTKENPAHETCMLSLCMHHPDRLKVFFNAIEGELDGDERDEFFAELIANKTRNNHLQGMGYLLALCKFAPKYDDLVVLVSKIFEIEALGLRFLREQLYRTPCFDSVLSRRLVSYDEEKMLLLMAGLSSITGLFEEQYFRFSDEKKEILRRICKIESGEWRRTKSTEIDSDWVGLLKHSIMKSASKRN